MHDKEQESEKTNFGFEKVSFNEKRAKVSEVFSAVAAKYDLMNDLMSFGLHRLWKDTFCSLLPNLNSSILDMAGGTGDIAFRIKERAKKQNKNPHIVICDINQNMLLKAQEKAINNNYLQGTSYVLADAEKLPFADNSFDYYTIAFGIRNVTKIDEALKQAYRVLRPGGKILLLEFSQISLEALKKFYDYYSFNIIPKIGNLVAHNKSAYQYLVESINLFPDKNAFKIMIQDAGFCTVQARELSFSVAAIHTGYKI